MSRKAGGNSNLEARRLQVWKLLRRVNEEKAVRAGQTSVLARVARAYGLATKPPEISLPLRCIAAYRWAHLLLRTAEPDFGRVNRLFEEASAFAPYSAVAQIYRVAVLERRLKMELNEMRRNELKTEQQEAFDGARKGLRVGPWPNAVVDGDELLGDHLQGGVFNMLELSSYFTGLPYDDLEGRGSRLDHALEREDWVVVGPERETSRVHFSEAAAKQELEDRARQSSGGEVFFRLAQATSSGYGHSDWRVAGQHKYDHQHQTHLKILALLCADQVIADEHALKQRLLSPQQSDDDYRQFKLRLKRGLERLLGRPVGELYEDLGGGGGLRLPRGLVAYGAVHVRALL